MPSHFHDFVFTPSGLNFGNVTVSTTSPALSITIVNNGYLSGSFKIIPVDARFVFTLTSTTGTVGPGGGGFLGTLQQGQNAVFSVVFNANAITGFDSSVFFIDDTYGGNAYTTSLLLTAMTVSGATPAWNVVPSSIDFGSLKVGTSSSPQNVKVSNTGSVNLVLNSITLNASDFALLSLPSFPVTITPGNNIVFQVQCNAEFSGLNDYNPGITLTPSVGSTQSVELIYTGFLINPAYVLTGNTQGVMFGFVTFWDTVFDSYIVQSLASLPCEAIASWSKMHDYDSAGSNVYSSKMFIRNEPSGAVTATLTATSIISDVVTSKSSTFTQTGVNDATKIPTWMQFDFEVNGEITKFDFVVAAGGGRMTTDLYVLQYEIRGVVYESK